MKIGYEYSEEDLMAMCYYSLKTTPSLLRKRRIRMLVFAVLIMVGGSASVLYVGNLILFFVVFAVLSIYVMLALFDDKELVRRTFLEQGLRPGRAELRICDQYLLIDDESSLTQLKYKAIKKIEHGGAYSRVFWAPHRFIQIPIGKIDTGSPKEFFNALASKCREFNQEVLSQ